MRIMPSWDSFQAKYPTKETQRARFEDLVRSLFCRRYNIKYGIFQCINHAGNETNTIRVGDEIIGCPLGSLYFNLFFECICILDNLSNRKIDYPNLPLF